MVILVVNAGSSSLKLALYALTGSGGEVAREPIVKIRVTWNDGIVFRTSVRGEERFRIVDCLPEQIFEVAVRSLWEGPDAILRGCEEIRTIAHRVVHGGGIFSHPVVIEPTILERLRGFVPLAPLHQQANLQPVELLRGLLPDVRQIAVFDTAFYGELPEEAVTYAVPDEWKTLYGVRRYGFHGISHKYCAQMAQKIAEARGHDLNVISCHLGAGCSVTATAAGASVGTTMGFTPLDGLVMATRCGSVDPGIILHVLGQSGMSLQVMSHILNGESGIRGISGLSGDMLELEREMAQENTRAKLAFDIYTSSVASHVSSLMPLLQRAEALVFTGGVGENSAAVRAAVCAKLAFLGVELDGVKNSSLPGSTQDVDIAGANSKMAVLIVKADEEYAIVQECAKLLQTC